MAGVRKQIYLEEKQERLLKHLSRKTGLSEEELIRNAIDLQVSGLPLTVKGSSAWEAELIYIRRLINKGKISGGRTWQRKDLHER